MLKFTTVKYFRSITRIKREINVTQSHLQMIRTVISMIFVINMIFGIDIRYFDPIPEGSNIYRMQDYNNNLSPVGT